MMFTKSITTLTCSDASKDLMEIFAILTFNQSNTTINFSLEMDSSADIMLTLISLSDKLASPRIRKSFLIPTCILTNHKWTMKTKIFLDAYEDHDLN